ncbi:carboxypeptidase-like regulatory domain-containing protein [Mucilaginibacter lutimaris]|uniref:Carboxypeptidase-like regulatory domain-containing protein n=1 Tax=Mucilaginibacter lutimaris TaxID=931629 RepID=A0ABW2ZIJ7_9SPHI
MKYFLLILLLAPLACLAQLRITGRIVNDGKPVADASVFLNNETIGTKSANDGTFTLRILSAGQHDLIISMVGFKTYHQTFMVNADLALGDIDLVLKTTMLAELKVAYNPKKEKALKEFAEQFLGSSQYAKQCEIINPEVLDLKYGRSSGILNGKADDFLEIANNALGYKLKYLLSNFSLNRDSDRVAYEGYVLFEEMPGTEEQKEQWARNRRDVYFGSPLHFLREILANRVDSSYSVEVLSSSTRSGGGGSKSFSVTNTTKPLKVKDYIHPTERPGIYAMGYEGSFFISYYPTRRYGRAKSKARFTGHSSRSGISFIDKFLYFDSNGTILNPMGASFNNAWAVTRVAQLLPIDYWPDEK